MRILLFACLLPLLAACADAGASATAGAAADLPAAAAKGGNAAPVKLGLCASCHGVAGPSRTRGTPLLAGQDEAYLASSLQAYREGRGGPGPMTALAGTLSDADVVELARHCAAQEGDFGP